MASLCGKCRDNAAAIASALGLRPGTVGPELVSVGCEHHEPRPIAEILGRPRDVDSFDDDEARTGYRITAEGGDVFTGAD